MNNESYPKSSRIFIYGIKLSKKNRCDLTDIDVHPLDCQNRQLPGNRDTMQLASITYWRRSSPVGQSTDRLLVPTLMETQLLQTTPINTQNWSSLAQRIIQMIVLRKAHKVISVKLSMKNQWAFSKSICIATNNFNVWHVPCTWEGSVFRCNWGKDM